MSQPRISVIIPIYRTESYLRECLDSVQNQMLTDFEAMLINDCTPDNSMQIAGEFARGDPRFRIIEHKTNQGLGAARNTGMKNAQGEYLFFLDSDDSIPIDTLYLLCAMADTCQADMVIGNMAWLDGDYLTPVPYIDAKIQSWLALGKENIRKLPERYHFTGSVANRLFRQQVITDHHLEFPQGIYFEDIPFSLAVWFFCQKVVFTPRIVYFRHRRVDPDNPSITQTYTEKAFFDRDISAQLIYDFAKDHPEACPLAAVTLKAMLSSTKRMIGGVDDDIKEIILDSWYPDHTARVNHMIGQINRGFRQRS